MRFWRISDNKEWYFFHNPSMGESAQQLTPSKQKTEVTLRTSRYRQWYLQVKKRLWTVTICQKPLWNSLTVAGGWKKEWRRALITNVPAGIWWVVSYFFNVNMIFWRIQGITWKRTVLLHPRKTNSSLSCEIVFASHFLYIHRSLDCSKRTLITGILKQTQS